MLANGFYISCPFEAPQNFSSIEAYLCNIDRRFTLIRGIVHYQRVPAMVQHSNPPVTVPIPIRPPSDYANFEEWLMPLTPCIVRDGMLEIVRLANSPLPPPPPPPSPSPQEAEGLPRNLRSHRRTNAISGSTAPRFQPLASPTNFSRPLQTETTHTPNSPSSTERHAQPTPHRNSQEALQRSHLTPRPADKSTTDPPPPYTAQPAEREETTTSILSPSNSALTPELRAYISTLEDEVDSYEKKCKDQEITIKRQRSLLEVQEREISLLRQQVEAEERVKRHGWVGT
ncbi:MAG: hypothetical protein Q9227_000079 [Pyrenula ochraceoflavens]